MISEQGFVKRELEFKGPYQRGSRGAKVKAVQEWLCLHGNATGIDSDYGAATELAVTRFQAAKGLPVTGIVGLSTWQALVKPMEDALKLVPRQGRDLPTLVVAYARQHLALHPREIGGQNCGPWVRLYMKGREGEPYAWCAGFVCFAVQQAAETTGEALPFPREEGCDALAARAKAAKIFVAERDVAHTVMPAGSIFLVRHTSTDWTHTGIVTRFGAETFDTIEGNTNDEGSREGYEVCARSRGYEGRDFISLANWLGATVAPSAKGMLAAVAPQTAEVTLKVATPGGVTVVAALTRKTDKSNPIPIPLKNGTGKATVVVDVPYILAIEFKSEKPFEYSVDVTTPAPRKLVSKDEEYPTGKRKGKAPRQSFSDTIEVVS